MPTGSPFKICNGTERIVIAGTSPMLSGNKIIVNRLRVDRFMPDGSYDPSFGVNGVAQVNIGSAYDESPFNRLTRRF